MDCWLVQYTLQIIQGSNINWRVFASKEYVSCALRTECSNKIQVKLDVEKDFTER
jgi:hypothetical protein